MDRQLVVDSSIEVDITDFREMMEFLDLYESSYGRYFKIDLAEKSVL